ncbi:uncharacterized protein DMAD_13071 [Drosophila madeirensis]|uniref:Uncharacterized protein n=1 Tax=Drosophila madeirensis TaxID=30013 RepID=A0AAU9FJI8_DROMD
MDDEEIEEPRRQWAEERQNDWGWVPQYQRRFEGFEGVNDEGNEAEPARGMSQFDDISTELFPSTDSAMHRYLYPEPDSWLQPEDEEGVERVARVAIISDEVGVSTSRTAATATVSTASLGRSPAQDTEELDLSFGSSDLQTLLGPEVNIKALTAELLQEEEKWVEAPAEWRTNTPRRLIPRSLVEMVRTSQQQGTWRRRFTLEWPESTFKISITPSGGVHIKYHPGRKGGV